MAAKQTIGYATCPICGGGPHPVKVSETDNLYMVCPPPADGGCKSQIFARDAHSNRLLAQRITKWIIPKEDRKKWLGSEPASEPDEADEELAEAIEDEEVEVVQPEPPPSTRPRPEPASPAPRPSKPSRPSTAKQRPRSQPKPKRGFLYWGDDEE